MMNENMEMFIDEEILGLSIEGAFQHAKIYKDDIAEDKKLELRNKLKEYLKNISPDYKGKQVTEEQHIGHLEKLHKDMSIDFSNILFENEFRIGIAQKALNLYLKYLWRLGKIIEPPHCPFDSIILNAINRSDIKWTEMKWIDEYKSIVESAKLKAGKESLAGWELHTWNDELKGKNKSIIYKLLD